MRILIAEDDTVSRLFLQRLLEKMGHTVTACVDGAVAWKSYQDGDYRMVLSDWMMPEMDGIRLVRAIRAANRPGYCYFIMVTARTAKSDFMEAMAAGADDCITKPLDKDEIEVRLRVGHRILALIERIRGGGAVGSLAS